MNRRTFLTALAAACTAGPAPAAKGPSQIIDTHTHFYDPKRPGGVPWPKPEETKLYRTVLPADFVRLTKPLGVTATVVVEASPLLEDNQWILDQASENPVIVGFIGHLDPGRSEFSDHLGRFHKNPLFRGIRLNGEQIQTGSGQTAFLDDMKRMGDAGLTLDAIGGPDMFGALEKLAAAVPTLRIVIDHLPFEPFAQKVENARYVDGLKRVAVHSNVFAKVSGVLRPDAGQSGATLRIDRLWRAFGEDRLVYASNWPVSDLAAPYADILAIVSAYFWAKGPRATEKFFWQNSVKAYSWVPRGAARVSL
jgi:predicted TIM-barrel fold metal-dependent hydrolase